MRIHQHAKQRKSGVGRRKSRHVRVKRTKAPEPAARFSPQELLSDADSVLDHVDDDLALLGDPSEPMEPRTTDEDILQEFHREVTRRGSHSLSGRML